MTMIVWFIYTIKALFGRIVMRKIVWSIWKKKTLFSLVIYGILSIILFYCYKGFSVSSNNPLILFEKILIFLNKGLPIVNPLVYLVFSFMIPFFITLFLGCIVRYYLLPGNKYALLEALHNRCYEVTELGRKEIERNIENLSSWIDGLRTGCSITAEKCQVLGREVIEITEAKTLYATCLQTPQELHDKLKGFSEVVAKEIKSKDKKLIRIIICDPSIFDLSSTSSAKDQAKIKWFVNLHNRSLILKYIERPKFKDLYTLYGVRPNKLDIMLFDKQVVYSLENDSETFEVIKNNNCYTLSLMDSSGDIRIYEKFMNELKENSFNVRDYIQNHGWSAQYSEDE